MKDQLHQVMLLYNILINLSLTLYNKLLITFLKLMKANQQHEITINKPRLPYLPKKPFNLLQLKNNSLKKIFIANNQTESSPLNNASLLPKLIQKAKQKGNQHKKIKDISFEKSNPRIYLINKDLKKRQKLSTQGQNSQSLTQIEDSFISLTNKMIERDQYTVQDTLFDFKRKIEQNKLIIKKEIQKKNKQNQASAKREKTFEPRKRVISSKVFENKPETKEKQYKKTIQTPDGETKKLKNLKQQRSSRQNQEERRKRQKTQIQHSDQQIQKSLTKRHSEGLFTDLQVILDDKIVSEQERFKKQQNKLKTLVDKLNRFKRQKNNSMSIQDSTSMSEQLLMLDSSEQIKSQNELSRMKRQNNYHEWNKIEFSSTSQISYRKSSFEQELRKVQEYTNRNDASLQKYLCMRQELLKLGFQFKCNKK